MLDERMEAITPQRDDTGQPTSSATAQTATSPANGRYIKLIEASSIPAGLEVATLYRPRCSAPGPQVQATSMIRRKSSNPLAGF